MPDMLARGIAAIRDWIRAQSAAYHAEVGAPSSGHGGSGGRWLVSYADFVTLMFGFFLILWASADPNSVKFTQLTVALQKAFNPGAMAGQDGAGQVVGAGGRQAQMEMSPFQRISETTGELVALFNLGDQVGIGLKREGYVITISGEVLFDPNSADVKPKGLEFLKGLVPVIDAAPGEVRIEGHTDNVPPSTPLNPNKEFASNWELSAARAGSILRYFTGASGLPTDRFRINGYAEYRPLVPNDSRENRAKNRRVEIVLLNPTTSFAKPEPAKPGAEPAPAGAIPAKPNADAKPGAIPVKPTTEGKPGAIPVKPPVAGAKPAVAIPPAAPPRATPGESPFLPKPSGAAPASPPAVNGQPEAGEAIVVPGASLPPGAADTSGQPREARPPVSVGAQPSVKPGQVQPAGPPPVVITGANSTSPGSESTTTQPGPRGIGGSQPSPVSIGPPPVNILPQFGGPPPAPRP